MGPWPKGRALASILLFFGSASADEPARPREILVEPSEITLTGRGEEHGLLVTALGEDGGRSDVTSRATLTTSAPHVIASSSAGRLRAVGDGEAEIDVSYGGRTARVRARVAGAGIEAEPSFRHEIVPILTRYGCNQGACHGKESGQNGFRLSLRGFDPESDHERIVLESRGRRVHYASPDLSLILAKPSGRMSHRGGRLLEEDSPAYLRLVRWIRAGTPTVLRQEPTLVGLEVLGGGRTLRAGQEQPLLVRARFSDGRSLDVTWLSKFFAQDSAVLEVSDGGRVRARREGASVVRAHYQDQVAVAAFTVPLRENVDPAPYAEKLTEIDRHVFEKLQSLGLPPSPPADDAAILRRAFLDTIGLLPTPEETVTFLEDRSPAKRARLVDELLERPEFVDFWAQWLGDLLQNRLQRGDDVRGSKGVRGLHEWLRREVAARRPWDEMARRILTSSGSSVENPPVGYFIVTVDGGDRPEQTEVVSAVAQSFLGTRIGCAKCHNHPEERYTQDDYYHFAAFFTALSVKRQSPERGPAGLEVMTPEEKAKRREVDDLEKYILKLEASLPTKSEADAQKAREQIAKSRTQIQAALKAAEEIRRRPPRAVQPRTRQPLAPRPLDGTEVPVAAGEDPRRALAEWITDPRNEYFSGSMVNRLWKHFMGSGLVEPVDDLRPSNPPSNEGLWKHLNQEFVGGGFDLRHVMRLILLSRAYQLSSATRPENERDRRFSSHYVPKRLPAETLLDAVSRATGVPESFPGYPVGIRASQLPEPTVDSRFLALFGRPERMTACACERSGEVTLSQLLHLQNGEGIHQKIRSSEGTLEALLRAGIDSLTIAETLFLATLSRRPREAERDAVKRLLESPGAERADVLRDLFWALLNSKEFVFNH